MTGRGAAGKRASDPGLAAAGKADAAVSSFVATGAPVPPAAGVDDRSPDFGGRVPDSGARASSARREATRRRVIDAAREVFAERGVIGGTVEDICERAGFTRGAFYSNFSDKDDVLAALIEQEHARLQQLLDERVAPVDREPVEAAGAAAAVSSIVDRILRSVPADRRSWLVRAELEIHAVRRPEVARPLIEANTRVRDRIGMLIGEAMARDGLELTVDPADLVEAVVAVMERSVRRPLVAGGVADPDAMARAVLPALLLGLSRPTV